MVYCPKCGTKNEDNAEFCVSCGTALQTGTAVTRKSERTKAEQECFGLPHGGAIAGIIIGAIILIWGVSEILKQSGVIEPSFDLWWLIIIIVGVLIVAGALYTITRPKKNP